jgi:hypothetical protein
MLLDVTLGFGAATKQVEGHTICALGSTRPPGRSRA